MGTWYPISPVLLIALMGAIFFSVSKVHRWRALITGGMKVVIGELKALLDLVDNISQKRKESIEQRIMDKVLVSVYKLGNDGTRSVNRERLEAEGGFSKRDIYMATRMGEDRGLLQHTPTMGNPDDWILTLKGCQYVEALLEDATSNQG